jgi:hypothetical protein
MGKAGYVGPILPRHARFRNVSLPRVDESCSRPLELTETQGMFFMFGSIDFIMGVFVYFCIPETKGMSLEKMDELFGVTEQVKTMEGGDAESEIAKVETIREEQVEDV